MEHDALQAVIKDYVLLNGTSGLIGLIAGALGDIRQQAVALGRPITEIQGWTNELTAWKNLADKGKLS